jgi:hypothetical protein
LRPELAGVEFGRKLHDAVLRPFQAAQGNHAADPARNRQAD